MMTDFTPFTPPTALKDVPSYSSDSTAHARVVTGPSMECHPQKKSGASGAARILAVGAGFTNLATLMRH